MGTLLLLCTALTWVLDTLILIFSVKLQDTQYQQLQRPQVHYLPRAQLLGSHLDCEVSVGPQRTHILKRETNQGRPSWQGHWKGGLQLIGVLICKDLLLSPAFGTRWCRCTYCPFSLGILWRLIWLCDDSIVIRIQNFITRICLYPSPASLPRAPLRIYSACIRVRGRMPNVSNGVAFSSLVSCPRELLDKADADFLRKYLLTFLAARNGTGWPFSWPSFGC